jgi:hypothetical protein
MVPQIVRSYFKRKLAHLNVRKDIDRGLHRLVLAEEDEAARFRRRMHLHLCMIGIAGGATLLSMLSVMDAASIVYITLGLNCTQEFVDYVGRF